MQFLELRVSFERGKRYIYSDAAIQKGKRKFMVSPGTGCFKRQSDLIQDNAAFLSVNQIVKSCLQGPDFFLLPTSVKQQ